MQNFRKSKSADFKKMLTDFIRLQVEYASKQKASWEGILADVEAI